MDFFIAISNQSTKNIIEKIVNTSMSGMLNLADIFEQVINRFYDTKLGKPELRYSQTYPK